MNPEFLLAFVFVFAAVAVAVPQATTAATDFPGCAYACINTMMSVTACGINDIKCQCADLEALRFTYQCIANACSTADFNKALNIDIAFCNLKGQAITDSAVAYITGGLTRTSALPTATATSNTAATPSSPSSSGSGGISTGAIIGIALTAAVIIVAFAIGAFLVLRRRRPATGAAASASGPAHANPQYPGPAKPAMLQQVQQVPQQQDPVYQQHQMPPQMQMPPQHTQAVAVPLQQQQHMGPPQQQMSPLPPQQQHQQTYANSPVYEMGSGVTPTGAGDNAWEQGKK